MTHDTKLTAQYIQYITHGTVHGILQMVGVCRDPYKSRYSWSPDCLLKLDLSGGPGYLQTPHFACVVTSPPKGSIDYRL